MSLYGRLGDPRLGLLRRRRRRGGGVVVRRREFDLVRVLLVEDVESAAGEGHYVAEREAAEE